jgi:hypothetical protein
MHVTVLNGSPKGDVSVTMQYVHFIAGKFPGHDFKIHNVARQIRGLEKKDGSFGRFWTTWGGPISSCGPFRCMSAWCRRRQAVHRAALRAGSGGETAAGTAPP